MVKLKGPAVSLEASGSIGGALTFSNWKGKRYARHLTTPKNPKSGGQVGMRVAMKFITQFWGLLDASTKGTWQTRADNMNVSPFNAYLSANLRRIRNLQAPSITDPPTETGDPVAIGVTVATAGVRSIRIDIPITDSNDNWGVAIYRSLSTDFDTAFDNLVQMIATMSIDTFSWVDSPLKPGTYYYNFRGFTFSGKLDSEDGEINATVL